MAKFGKLYSLVKTISQNGFIEIINGNKSTKINTSEIDRLTLDRGIVTLRKIDAKSGFFGIGSSGIF